jgi:hypothetical protein
MKELTELLEPYAADMEIRFHLGAAAGARWRSIGDAYALFGEVRERYGFAPAKTRIPLLTPPDANMKLDKATTPSFGLTIQHYVQKLSTGLTVNACPFAGDCVKVCVLDNGMGRYSRVQLARRAKTEFLVEYPREFATLLGYELAMAVKKHGKILFRPNVNSDVAWERLLPSLVNGHIDGVTSYGYSKRPEVLDTNGWLGTHYRVAYSWNEKSDPDAIEEFIVAGGSVAVVTSRKKGEPVADAIKLGEWEYSEGGDDTPHLMDADATDEWIFTDGAIGDLSAKGKARSLVGKSGFVVTV